MFAFLLVCFLVCFFGILFLCIRVGFWVFKKKKKNDYYYYCFVWGIFLKQFGGGLFGVVGYLYVWVFGVFFSFF